MILFSLPSLLSSRPSLIYLIKSLRFGLTIFILKTKTMSFNAASDVMSSTSLVSLQDGEIENVGKFTYLGHTLSNDQSEQSAFISQRLQSAYAKWNDLKQVQMDKRVYLTTQAKFLSACVRSRLTYSVQAGMLNASETTKLESIWMNFLRRLVRKGFERENVPPARRRTRFRASHSSCSSRSSQSEPTENAKKRRYRLEIQISKCKHFENNQIWNN